MGVACARVLASALAHARPCGGARCPNSAFAPPGSAGSRCYDHATLHCRSQAVADRDSQSFRASVTPAGPGRGAEARPHPARTRAEALEPHEATARSLHQANRTAARPRDRPVAASWSECMLCSMRGAHGQQRSVTFLFVSIIAGATDIGAASAMNPLVASKAIVAPACLSRLLRSVPAAHSAAISRGGAADAR